MAAGALGSVSPPGDRAGSSGSFSKECLYTYQATGTTQRVPPLSVGIALSPSARRRGAGDVRAPGQVPDSCAPSPVWNHALGCCGLTAPRQSFSHSFSYKPQKKAGEAITRIQGEVPIT